MKRIIRDIKAVSPVIGAIMLTLIVVSAASAFAIFVAQKQEERIEAEAKLEKIRLEKLVISEIDDINYDSSANLTNVNFTIKNQNIHSSMINLIEVNNLILKYFNVSSSKTPSKEITWTLNNDNGKFTREIIYGNSSGELFIFNDVNRNRVYDNEIDHIIDLDFIDPNLEELDPDNNSTDANPTDADNSLLYGLDNANNPYVFHDKNGNFSYDLNEFYHLDPDGDGNDAIIDKGDSGEEIFYSETGLEIEPSEIFYIMTTNIYRDSYHPITNPNISSNEAITFKISTKLTNTFEKSFIPPNAIITLETKTQSFNETYKDYILLDGSESDHPGDGNIIEWKWEIISSEQYAFVDINDDGLYDAGDLIYDFDNDSNLIDAEANPSDIINPASNQDDYIQGANASGQWFIFMDDGVVNDQYDTGIETILVTDADGDGTPASPSGGETGYLCKQANSTTSITLPKGRIVRNDLITDGREYTIILTVKDNYGMISTSELDYQY